MGFMSSSWYKSKIIEIENKIAEEIELAGVKQAENGDDQIEFYEDRLVALERRKEKYEQEYEKALTREGLKNNSSFIPRRETGN